MAPIGDVACTQVRQHHGKDSVGIARAIGLLNHEHLQTYELTVAGATIAGYLCVAGVFARGLFPSSEQ